jgi:hypothetical protein
MQDVMSQRQQLSKQIMSTLQQLHQRFPKNISFAIDEYGECNITINKDCGGSNIPIAMFKCRCCKTVVNFAKQFNENFDFLLELDTPLNFLKLSVRLTKNLFFVLPTLLLSLVAWLNNKSGSQQSININPFICESVICVL